ncbi:Peptidase M24A, methionine aminopeptidase, subfamily 2 [Moelleriella libera RCEF 2490]|uniref:Methionine aminopeptidase 2 n=1 Tax=Moelleriella libera RCEF 2490 TaxID=1081109 RepID=A0A166UVP9_9HYPO|nr:Peptidase M24A, methionine aminopeptidase, subfamily 2 [Moelleriella libera RCEF 2490]
MGSKTPENEDNRRHDNAPSNASVSAGGQPRGQHLARDGDGCMGSDGAGDSDDDDDDDCANDRALCALLSSSLTALDAGAAETGPNKNKKKRKKPKSKSKKKKKTNKGTSKPEQSSPPRVPLHQLFPSHEYPPGELLDHYRRGSSAPVTEQTTVRASFEELRVTAAGRTSLEDAAFLNDYRQAAETHRQVRRWVQTRVRPGQTLTEIATGIEDGVRALLDNDGLGPGQGLRSGLGFPTGLSVNHCVAHYTPNPGGQPDMMLQEKDVMKVDFGVQINGWIVDSAFTMSFDPTYDNLLAAVKDATNTGIKNAGIDVRISDVSAAIQEAMESYEVEINGKVFPVRPVKGLCGHDIKRYRIHGEKTVPFVRNAIQTKMEEGDIFAIETFGTTGRGFVKDGVTSFPLPHGTSFPPSPVTTYCPPQNERSGFMTLTIKTQPGVYGYGLCPGAPERVHLPLTSANRLYKTIRDNFGTLVFCRRYLERLGVERYLVGVVAVITQQTVLLRSSQKEVISRGDDY